ncbi:MAG: response regulator [Acidobacteria bacterium]|nr:response regulator [Acidobacteriota bacterium]MBI3488257.1 response regulator [Acidobacteriota bacterium]
MALTLICHRCSCGRPCRTLEHLFEPFFTTKSEGKGTGLGLSTAYGIVTQNSGAITAYSNPGLGTSMKIYLPDCGGEALETSPGLEASVPGGTKTVLVVEGEKPMVDILTLVLEDKGYHVLSAQNGLDGYLLARDHPGPLDLLITDVVMPGLNGKELQERILGLRLGLKVLFISGYTGDILAKLGLLPEETQFLQKPFRGLDLARKVREVLDR